MRVLAIDHGTVRMGIAMSDELKMIAQPLKFIPAEPFSGFLDRLKELLHENEVELICLAGFMRVLSEDFVASFPHKIINIHPSLLPAFPGLQVQKKAIEYGVRHTGCTVHFVVPEVDAGPIILQAVVPIEQGDTAETLAARILEKEHLVYPKAVKLFAQGRLSIEGRRVLISEEGKDNA